MGTKHTQAVTIHTHGPGEAEDWFRRTSIACAQGREKREKSSQCSSFPLFTQMLQLGQCYAPSINNNNHSEEERGESTLTLLLFGSTGMNQRAHDVT